MVKSRVLPLLNAIGCLILTGVIVLQWRKERTLDEAVAQLGAGLHTANGQAATEAKRAAALERDIAVLKESIEATQQAAEAASRLLAEKEARVSALETETASAREQLTLWQNAVTMRDQKLRDLVAELTATRRRLDEAAAKLNAAAVR
jgi:chromosome segregation ATPase